MAVVPQSSSLDDIRSGLRNRYNSAIDFVPQDVNTHTKQSSNSQSSVSSNQRNDRPKTQDKSSNPLSSPQATAPTVPPLSDLRTFSPVNEITTSPLSQFPSERVGAIQEAVAKDDTINNADQKPVHWPKQAPTVHWITPEEEANSTGNVARGGAPKP
jgi:hypothetical protein